MTESEQALWTARLFATQRYRICRSPHCVLCPGKPDQPDEEPEPVRLPAPPRLPPKPANRHGTRWSEERLQALRDAWVACPPASSVTHFFAAVAEMIGSTAGRVGEACRREGLTAKVMPPEDKPKRTYWKEKVNG